jgi:hypothetical protein
MTRSRTTGTGIPGLTIVQGLTSAYFELWEQQVQALNDVWGQATGPNSKLEDWPKAWNTLVHTWAENIQNACVSQGVGGFFGHGGSPLAVFAIDRTAETDAEPLTILLPFGVDPKKLIATPLVSLTQDGHPALASATIVLLHTGFGLEIRVKIDRQMGNGAPPPGYYIALVCEPKAGNPRHPLTNAPVPPSRTVVAVVLVHFI